MNEPRVNIPEWSVTELAAALKKTVEDAYGFVRVRGEITGYRGPHSSGHCLFRAQGRRRQDRRRDLEGRVRPHPLQARGRAGGDRDRAAHDLSRPLVLPDHRREPGAGRHRRADGAARGAQEEARRRRPVRRGAQAAAAVSADGDRRRHLADRRGDPRHPASARRTVSRAACWSGRCGCRARARPKRSRPRSAASTRCPRAGGCRARI